jgi:plasmid stabilization system protein ParE
MKWLLTGEAEADLIAGREWIELDHPAAAQAMLETAREVFDKLAKFPEMGAAARLKGGEFSEVRFFVLSPPFNRWIVFYRVTARVEIIRVLYGTQNWRQQPRRFF